MRPLRVRERVLADGGVGWSVDGSPTDAVSLAFLGYFDVGFDLVASGINYGANLGDDVTYSGTVSAAMEAVINGCPAFAMSLEYYQHPDFELAGRMARLVAVNILEHGLAPGELLNVNVPAIAAEELEGIAVTRMGKRIYQDQLIERLDPRGVPYYWIGGPAPVRTCRTGHRLPRHGQPAHRGHAHPARLHGGAAAAPARALGVAAAGGPATRPGAGRGTRPTLSAGPQGRCCITVRSPLLVLARTTVTDEMPAVPRMLRYRTPPDAGSRSGPARWTSPHRW